ncbi:MAG: hypothetical protein PHC92_05660 [Syntrophomonadaceae bacterium]|nr:hypothetical protein [Syntrophomonadaceae bacterium]MDD3023327.1 hypothetical protein [Syntrophomonadaceae bacterium]
MDKPATRSIPMFIPLIIVTILASMYYYAAFVESSPEKTVQDFYQSYFERDYDSVTKNLSVFWSIRFLPQYSSMTPAQLLENRENIEKEASKVIAQIESENKLPQNISIEIMPEYTKKSESSALVVYSFKEDGQVSGMELAILIKEKGKYRIFNMSPVAPQDLEQIQQGNLQELDAGFKKLLTE